MSYGLIIRNQDQHIVVDEQNVSYKLSYSTTGPTVTTFFSLVAALGTPQDLIFFRPTVYSPNVVYGAVMHPSGAVEIVATSLTSLAPLARTIEVIVYTPLTAADTSAGGYGLSVFNTAGNLILATSIAGAMAVHSIVDTKWGYPHTITNQQVVLDPTKTHYALVQGTSAHKLDFALFQPPFPQAWVNSGVVFNSPSLMTVTNSRAFITSNNGNFEMNYRVLIGAV